MDEIDRGNEQAEQTLAHLIASVRRQASDRLSATGSCHNCDDRVMISAIFCGAECRFDYDKRAQAQRRLGR